MHGVAKGREEGENRCFMNNRGQLTAKSKPPLMSVVWNQDTADDEMVGRGSRGKVGLIGGNI